MSTQLHRDAGLSVLRCDNLLIAAWHAAPTLAQMRIVERHIDGWRLTYGNEVVFVNVIVEGRMDAFSAEARDAANRLTEKYPRSLCVANVVLIGGLPGMLIRTVLRAMRMVGRYESPWKVFDDNQAAATWIAPQLDGHLQLSWTTASILAVLEEAQRR